LIVVVCDGLARDPGTGKSTLYGVFDRIAVHEFPATVPISVYAKLADGNGRYVVSVDVLDPRGKSVVVNGPTLEMDCAHGKRGEIGVVGLPLRLIRAGTHRVGLTVGEKRMGLEYEICVVQLPRQEQKE
jgi:hypothetical protein